MSDVDDDRVRVDLIPAGETISPAGDPEDSALMTANGGGLGAALTGEGIARLLGLLREVDSVGLKLAVPESYQRSGDAVPTNRVAPNAGCLGLLWCRPG